MDILLIVACLYMAYMNIANLAQIPFAEWGLIQYTMVVLTVLLVVVGALKGWQYYNKKKRKAEEPQGEEILPKEAAAEEQWVQNAAAEAVATPAESAFSPPKEVDESILEDWEIETADFNYTLVELPKNEP